MLVINCKNHVNAGKVFVYIPSKYNVNIIIFLKYTLFKVWPSRLILEVVNHRGSYDKITMNILNCNQKKTGL
jgi:hypothetical protein